jgi:hypothetical protein
MHFDVACFQGECICLGGAFRLCLLIALLICSGGACELVCALCSITCVLGELCMLLGSSACGQGGLVNLVHLSFRLLHDRC